MGTLNFFYAIKEGICHLSTILRVEDGFGVPKIGMPVPLRTLAAAVAGNT